MPIAMVNRPSDIRWLLEPYAASNVYWLLHSAHILFSAGFELNATMLRRIVSCIQAVRLPSEVVAISACRGNYQFPPRQAPITYDVISETNDLCVHAFITYEY
jgi:hypothetical protein